MAAKLAVLAANRREELSDASCVITAPPRSRASTPIKLVFETPDLEAARAHLASNGAVMHEPRSSGSCDGLDPEGNVFQIVRTTAK